MAVGMFTNQNGCPQKLQDDCTSTQALAFAPPQGIQTLFGVGGLAGYGGQWPAIIWHDYFMNNFNTVPVQSWPALPANFGSAWNLVPPLPKPKPRPQPCDNGNGNGNPFRCRNGNQNQNLVICLPNSPIPCPTASPGVPPVGGGAGGAAGAGTVGGVAAGGIVATGLTVTMLPAGIRRWRPRRRQRGPGAGKRKT
jgi:hypothetical protein